LYFKGKYCDFNYLHVYIYKPGFDYTHEWP
jgi:hypothetical protein